jgi:hypothetical protein
VTNTLALTKSQAGVDRLHVTRHGTAPLEEKSSIRIGPSRHCPSAVRSMVALSPGEAKRRNTTPLQGRGGEREREEERESERRRERARGGAVVAPNRSESENDEEH